MSISKLPMSKLKLLTLLICAPFLVFLLCELRHKPCLSSMVELKGWQGADHAGGMLEKSLLW